MKKDQTIVHKEANTVQNAHRLTTNLRQLAFDHDVSISKIARKTNISRTTLTALYKGSGSGITFSVLEKLCNYFQCDVGDLLILTDKPAKRIKENTP